MPQSQLEDLLDQVPTLPEVPIEITKKIDDPQGCDLREIGRLAARDPIVAMHLMRLANSALFGGGGKTTTVIDAVIRLGLTETRKVVLTIALLQAFDKARHGFEVRQFWCFSLASGVCAERVARDLGYALPPHAYLAGLLHRICDVVLALHSPESFQKALELSAGPGETLDDGIEKVFNVTGPDLCAEILRRWNFSDLVVDAVEHQSRPQDSPLDQELPWIIFIAGRLCRIVGVGFGRPRADGLDWVENVPDAFAERLFPADVPDLLDYVASRWSFLQEVENLVSSLFRR